MLSVRPQNLLVTTTNRTNISNKHIEQTYNKHITTRPTTTTTITTTTNRQPQTDNYKPTTTEKQHIRQHTSDPHTFIISYICVCMYECMYVCVCVYMHVLVCLFVCLLVCVSACVCVCECVYVCVCVSVCVCMCEWHACSRWHVTDCLTHSRRESVGECVSE